MGPITGSGNQMVQGHGHGKEFGFQAQKAGKSLDHWARHRLIYTLQRAFCAEESQIIYVETSTYMETSPYKEMEHNFPILGYGWSIVTSFQRVQHGRERKSNLTAEKPDKHHLSQLTKVNISGEESCRWHSPLINVMRMTLYLCGLLPSNL